MAQQTINIGSVANDGTGDPIRDAFDKCNDNFSELYASTSPTGVLVYKGAIDAGSNPNYPTASSGWAYVISVAGKIGGASGLSVDAGDLVFATADNAGGTHAAVGASWTSIEHNGIYGGSVSFASASEVNGGSEAAKAVSPDSLAGSNFGKAVVTILVSDPAGSAITTGDGKAYWRVPSTLNGMNLVAVAAAVTTVSSSGIPTVQIANVTDGVDMLSTKLTIDASETDSSTATTAAVIDLTKDDIATGDMLRIDIDVAGTGAKGLMVELQFQLP